MGRLREAWYPVALNYWNNPKVREAVEDGGLAAALTHHYVIAQARRYGAENGAVPISEWDPIKVRRWAGVASISKIEAQKGMDVCLEVGLVDRSGDNVMPHDYIEFLLAEKREKWREKERKRRETERKGEERRESPDLSESLHKNKIKENKNGGTEKGSTEREREEVSRRGRDEFPLSDGEKRKHHELVDWMCKEMRGAKPDCALPSEAKLNRWYRDMRLLVDLDKRDPRQIAKVIRFVCRDRFWAPNVRSPGKLREKFDQLEMAMKSGRGDEVAAPAPADGPGQKRTEELISDIRDIEAPAPGAMPPLPWGGER